MGSEKEEKLRVPLVCLALMIFQPFQCQVCSRAKLNKNSQISFCKILKTNSAI